MRLEAHILRSSFELARELNPDLGALLVGRLVRRHPPIRAEVEAMGGSADRTILDMVGTILQRIGEPHWVQMRLLSLGAMHPTDGDTQLFECVMDTLVDTLRECCGEGWTVDAERAWSQATDEFARLVRVGAKAALSLQGQGVALLPRAHR